VSAGRIIGVRESFIDSLGDQAVLELREFVFTALADLGYGIPPDSMLLALENFVYSRCEIKTPEYRSWARQKAREIIQGAWASIQPVMAELETLESSNKKGTKK
jgi:hypothetical protein